MIAYKKINIFPKSKLHSVHILKIHGIYSNMRVKTGDPVWGIYTLKDFDITLQCFAKFESILCFSLDFKLIYQI